MHKEKIIEWLAEGNISIPKLLITRYAKLGLIEEEFMVLIHVYTFICAGNKFPTPDQIIERMSISATRCTDVLRKLMQKGFLTIDEQREENGMFSESYSLKPLWEKLAVLFMEEDKKEDMIQQQQTETNLFTLFESEFGRPLSPMECESLSMWIDEDGYNPKLIKTALREAVMLGKLNIRYIDRILFEWKKNGIKTIEQATSYGKRFRKSSGSANNKSATNKESGEKVSIPFYNWLES